MSSNNVQEWMRTNAPLAEDDVPPIQSPPPESANPNDASADPELMESTGTAAEKEDTHMHLRRSTLSLWLREQGLSEDSPLGSAFQPQQADVDHLVEFAAVSAPPDSNLPPITGADAALALRHTGGNLHAALDLLLQQRAQANEAISLGQMPLFALTGPQGQRARATEDSTLAGMTSGGSDVRPVIAPARPNNASNNNDAASDDGQPPLMSSSLGVSQFGATRSIGVLSPAAYDLQDPEDLEDETAEAELISSLDVLPRDVFDHAQGLYRQDGGGIGSAGMHTAIDYLGECNSSIPILAGRCEGLFVQIMENGLPTANNEMYGDCAQAQ